MIVRFDPFREVERLADQAWGPRRFPRSAVPIDVRKIGNELVASFDLPGASPDTIELTVDKHDLTVTAQRNEVVPDGSETLIKERLTGSFTRRLHLGDGLDLDKVSADYSNGVLKVTIPLAEEARPRRVEVHVAPQVEAGTGPSTEDSVDQEAA